LFETKDALSFGELLALNALPPFALGDFLFDCCHFVDTVFLICLILTLIILDDYDIIASLVQFYLNRYFPSLKAGFNQRAFLPRTIMVIYET